MNASRKVGQSLVGFALLSAGSASAADAIAVGTAHYQAGMQAYAAKNYAVCADELYLAYTATPAKDNRAILLLAYCQEKLGNRKFAATNLNRVSASAFSGNERLVYDSLEKALEKELDVYHPYTGWVMPFVSFGAYSANSSKSSMYDLGASGGIAHNSWSLNIGADYLSLTSNSTTVAAAPPLPPGPPGSSKGPTPLQASSEYTQTQFSLGGAWTVVPAFWLRANAAYVNTSSSALGSVYVLGTGLGYVPWQGTQLGLEYEVSDYPTISLGGLLVHQITPSVDQRLWSSVTALLHLTVGVQASFASANSTTDSSTQFTLKSTYQRYFAELELRIDSWVMAVQGWGGSEAFGVRNQGGLIINALEEHKYGGVAKLGYQLTPGVFVLASGAVEGFNASGVDSKSYSGLLGVTFSF